MLLSARKSIAPGTAADRAIARGRRSPRAVGRPTDPAAGRSVETWSIPLLMVGSAPIRVKRPEGWRGARLYLLDPSIEGDSAYAVIRRDGFRMESRWT